MNASDLQGRHLHFDAPSGAAGDMTLGALFDLGVPEAVVRAALERLGLGGYRLSVAKTLRRGLAGTDVKVLIDADGDPLRHEHTHVPGLRGPHRRPHDAPGWHAHGEAGHDHDHDAKAGHVHDEAGHDHDHDHDAKAGHAHDEAGHDHDHDHEAKAGHAHARGHAHRHYGEIAARVRAHTEGRTRELALAIFDRIAHAEAKLHGVTPDEVVFHEVGAIDSIVDVVGTAAALAWLAPVSVSATPLAVGFGVVRSAHGLLPVPAPATLEICRAAGVPTVDGGLAHELLTPTGAAILASVVSSWGPAPAMIARAVGYGAGDADFLDRANLLRAVVGDRSSTARADDLVLLEANLDDMLPELCEHVAERLFAEGAIDVWWTPVVMKKSRPAVVLAALGPSARQEALGGVIFSETTTLGLRIQPIARRSLARRIVRVSTAYGPLAVKLGFDGERLMNVAPEYEECRAAARTHSVPLKEVYAAAIAAYRAASVLG